MGRPYRVACLVTHPIQYQAPLFRHLASNPGIDLTVFFLSDVSLREYADSGFGVGIRWDVPLLEGYRSTFLPALGSDRLSWFQPLTYRVWGHLRAGHFDALWVHGYSHFTLLRAILAATSLRIKVLLRGDSNLYGNTHRSAKNLLKQALLPNLFRLVDGYLAVGTLNRQYYLHYGAARERIFMMPYAVDNQFFRRRAEDAQARREDLRGELGLEPNRPIILYVSKLQPHKRPIDLLDSYIRLSKDGRSEPYPYLLVLGDGELRPTLEQRVRELGWSSVRLLGFKNQTSLPRYYDLCDVFVLPSEREPWGLVVNEVMNAGKPVIVTNRVGAGPDLVREGENGFVVPVGDIRTLSDRLRLLTSRTDMAVRMGRASLKRISEWNFESDRLGLLTALESIVGRSAE